MRRTAFYLTGASAVSILFSIAVSQILMGAALAALFLSDEKLRFPPIKLPLALFFVLTVAAVLLSGDPMRGLPQIKKFFVFAIALLICSTFRTIPQVRVIVLLWTAVASVSAVWSLVQFRNTYREAQAVNANIYDFVLDKRTTGFASHWMTFGGEEMIVLLMLAALLFFSRERRAARIGWFCLALIGISLVLGMTRSIYLLGMPIGLAYLLWNWKRRLLLAAPLAAVALFAVSPLALRERAISVVQPHGAMDSNEHRGILRRTGWQMVKAHPWFGLGPEQIAPQFYEYVPPDIPRPLPIGWYGHLHNIYLQYAAERGVPALLVLLWLIGKIIHDFLVALRDPALSSEARFVLHGGVAVILAVLTEGFFEHNLGDTEVLTMFLSVVSCGYIAARHTN